MQAAGQAGSGESQKNTIRGVVVNSVTHEPVARALVYSPDNRFATLTDDQGRFEFVLPGARVMVSEGGENSSPEQPSYFYAASPGMLMARKPGFLGAEGRQVWDQAAVVPGKDVTIALVPEGRIVGRVVLPTSNASDRITVRLYRRLILEGRGHWTQAGDIIARSNGEFRFADLEPGAYKLLTGELMDRDPLTFDPRGPIYGYPPAYFPNATDFQTAGTIQLTPGMTFQAELSPVRQPYYPVKIPVTNVPPDSQIIVSVSVQGRKGPGFELGYNMREQRIEGGLPNGTYAIEATDLGGNGMSGSVNLVVKDRATESAAMTMTPNGSVLIRVKREFKATTQGPDEASEKTEQGPSRQQQLLPADFNARLEVADEFGVSEMFFRAQTAARDENSELITGVGPGRYWVRVDTGHGFVASVMSGDVDLLRRPLTVGPAANVVVDVTIRDEGANVSGSIEGIGAPTPGGTGGISTTAGNFANGSTIGTLPHVYFLPLPESTGQFREVAVGEDGRFDLQQVPPGAYRVLAFDHPQTELEYYTAESMRAYEGKGQVVRLGAGQKEQLTLHLTSTSE